MSKEHKFEVGDGVVLDEDAPLNQEPFNSESLATLRNTVPLEVRLVLSEHTDLAGGTLLELEGIDGQFWSSRFKPYVEPEEDERERDNLVANVVAVLRSFEWIEEDESVTGTNLVDRVREALEGERSHVLSIKEEQEHRKRQIEQLTKDRDGWRAAYEGDKDRQELTDAWTVLLPEFRMGDQTIKEYLVDTLAEIKQSPLSQRIEQLIKERDAALARAKQLEEVGTETELGALRKYEQACIENEKLTAERDAAREQFGKANRSLRDAHREIDELRKERDQARGEVALIQYGMSDELAGALGVTKDEALTPSKFWAQLIAQVHRTRTGMNEYKQAYEGLAENYPVLGKMIDELRAELAQRPYEITGDKLTTNQLFWSIDGKWLPAPPNAGGNWEKRRFIVKDNPQEGGSSKAVDELTRLGQEMGDYDLVTDEPNGTNTEDQSNSADVNRTSGPAEVERLKTVEPNIETECGTP